MGAAISLHQKLGHVRSPDPASQPTQLVALDAIPTALPDPPILIIEPLSKLDAVLAAQANPLLASLQMFLSSGLDDLLTHTDSTGEYGACPRQVERWVIGR